MTPHQRESLASVLTWFTTCSCVCRPFHMSAWHMYTTLCGSLSVGLSVRYGVRSVYLSIHTLYMMWVCLYMVCIYLSVHGVFYLVWICLCMVSSTCLYMLWVFLYMVCIIMYMERVFWLCDTQRCPQHLLKGQKWLSSGRARLPVIWVIKYGCPLLGLFRTTLTTPSLNKDTVLSSKVCTFQRH
jgi:hypothetical protein